MLCQNLVHHRSVLLDSLLLCSLLQVPNTEALTTFFQTTFKAKGNNHPLVVKGEVVTDINSNQTSFKIFDNVVSLTEVWDQTARNIFVDELNSCPQVRFPFLGEVSISALLIDNCLFSGITLGHALSELHANSVIWVDMPVLRSSGSNKRILPIFRVTKASINEDQLIIRAQPLNCNQCPYRPRNSNSDSKCCGGCDHSSKTWISDDDLVALSRKEIPDYLFEPVEIRYQLSTKELDINLNTTQGVFTAKLFQHPTEASISEHRLSSVAPLTLLLSATILARQKTEE